MHYFKVLVSVSLIIFFSSNVLAEEKTLDEAAKLNIFTTSCLKRWMQDAPPNKESPQIKSVGEKFCTCAGQHILVILEDPKIDPIEKEARKKRESQQCLVEAVLNETANPTIKPAANEHLEMTCNKAWLAVFPKGLSESLKLYTSSFCRCASSQLVELQTQKSKLSPTEFNERLNHIAVSCKK